MPNSQKWPACSDAYMYVFGTMYIVHVHVPSQHVLSRQGGGGTRIQRFWEMGAFTIPTMLKRIVTGVL